MRRYNNMWLVVECYIGQVIEPTFRDNTQYRVFSWREEEEETYSGQLFFYCNILKN
jgi:hypothetical protein